MDTAEWIRIFFDSLGPATSTFLLRNPLVQRRKLGWL